MRNIAERAVAVECYKYESEADAILECCDSEESAESKIVNSISRCVRFDTVATLIVERTILSRTRDAVGKRRERERGELGGGARCRGTEADPSRASKMGSGRGQVRHQNTAGQEHNMFFA